MQYFRKNAKSYAASFIRHQPYLLQYFEKKLDRMSLFYSAKILLATPAKYYCLLSRGKIAII
jgi:hypothetical protein